MSDSEKRPQRPDLSTFGAATPPVLELEAGPQPPPLGAADGSTASFHAASPTVAVAIMVVAGLLALAVLLPLATMRHAGLEGDGRDHSWWDRLQGLIHGDDDGQVAVDAVEAPVEPGASAALPEIETDSSPSVAAAASKPLASLVGRYCFDYMPGGKDAAAVATFDSLVWAKLSENQRERVRGRMDVCSPFEWVGSDYIHASNCQKGQCGQNDVGIFIDRQGRVAFELREEGQCSKAVEEDFASPDALCKDS
jgi:hypothetical protein